MEAASIQNVAGVRVAVEGCGHGTLHAIYGSINEACRVQGWDSVDLVIIGGDFQAVRNKLDLEVTAMPQKYRKMADFHEYYSGVRRAPYLTVFIGGNHEASNHLFELYYGGWVAPNIYYLGATNVVRFGPLKIASLSGIWKGYDYRKPHFERLPYNEEELTSIYHVREVDARKLLAYSDQVDIGLSHDWPQGIEWHGDSDQLFKYKSFLADDAKSGRLGSVAARQCLERLRPAYWFSAHLHARYTAVLNHGHYESVNKLWNDSHVRGKTTAHVSQNAQHVTALEEADFEHKKRSLQDITNENMQAPSGRLEDRPQVAAWQNFGDQAQKADSEEREQLLREQETRREQERNGLVNQPRYNFVETFRQVTTDDGFGRTVGAATLGQLEYEDEPAVIPQLDGCGFSRPRKRPASNPDEISVSDEGNLVSASEAVDGAAEVNAEGTYGQAALSNPDAIDVEDSDEEIAQKSNGHVTTKKLGEDPQTLSPSIQIPTRSSYTNHQTASNSMSSASKDASVRPESRAIHAQSIQDPDASIEKADDAGKSQMNLANGAADIDSTTNEHNDAIDTETPSNDISDDLRAELASLSSKFAEPQKVEMSATLPLPSTIFNSTTQFLALSKCESNQEFLQLLEISSITNESSTPSQPLKLHYDPEWLAIQRVFAPELSLGGNSSDSVPHHRGDTYYRDRIQEEMTWVEEHVVQANLLKIPENFSITASIYDPDLEVNAKDMPRETTNPQTSAYCELIGIENKFDVSEEERDERISNGPRAESASFSSKQHRQRGGGQGNRGGYHGNRGGRGQGMGRGRGRGRGRW